MKFIEWSITDICNYRCSYCIGGVGRIDPISKNQDYKKIVNNLVDSLEGEWNIVITGSGEPLIVKDFLYIVKKLVDNNHKVSVMTNFSLPVEEIIELCSVGGRNFCDISASLHPEYVDPKQFLKKIKIVKNRFKEKNISVNMVAQKDKIDEINGIVNYFKKNGIKIFLQAQRYFQDDQKTDFVNYSKDEKKALEKQEKYSNFNSSDSVKKGKMCKAGKEYAVIGVTSRVWRCWPADEDGNRDGYIGNLNEGTVKFLNESKKCIYAKCTCDRPIVEGMVD